MRVNRTEIIELKITIADNAAARTQWNFPANTILNGVPINGLAISPVEMLQYSYSNNDIITTAQLQSAFLTLYCFDPVKKQWGEWIKDLPLLSLVPTATKKIFQLPNLLIDWGKSYISSRGALGVSTWDSIIHFTAFYGGASATRPAPPVLFETIEVAPSPGSYTRVKLIESNTLLGRRMSRVEFHGTDTVPLSRNGFTTTTSGVRKQCFVELALTGNDAGRYLKIPFHLLHALNIPGYADNVPPLVFNHVIDWGNSYVYFPRGQTFVSGNCMLYTVYYQ